MPQHHPLIIAVNNQLTIDAGYWQEWSKKIKRLPPDLAPANRQGPADFRIWRKRPKI